MPGKNKPVGYMGYDSANKMKDASGYMKPDAASKMSHMKMSHAEMSHMKMSHMKMSKELTYGGPVIDQEPGALSRMGAMKVLKHSNSRM